MSESFFFLENLYSIYDLTRIWIHDMLRNTTMISTSFLIGEKKAGLFPHKHEEKYDVQDLFNTSREIIEENDEKPTFWNFLIIIAICAVWTITLFLLQFVIDHGDSRIVMAYTV